MASRPLGIFDSGIGGLSILREIRTRLPGHDLIYFADQVHVPYGPRPLNQVRLFSEGITRFLLDQGAGLIVVACNTASAAALRPLRQVFPTVRFIGMEPAVKPAAQTTETRVLGVLATPATFQGELYASVVERFAQGVRVINQTVPGLVERIEAGDLTGSETVRLLREALAPLLAEGADTLVLACTHYPFVIPTITEIAGPSVRVIDPTPAIARQVERVLGEIGLAAARSRPGQLRLITSGDPGQLRQMAEKLIGEQAPAERAVWDENRLTRVDPASEH
ncbi:MAG TPA: glutamate racemase [Anaerolineales bacterium]|nr:glutamate racemase [Anaerolineales bacterium]